MSLDRGSKKTRKEVNSELGEHRGLTVVTIITGAGKINPKELYKASEERILRSGLFIGKNEEKVKAGLVRAAAESSNNAIDNISSREFN